MSCEQTQFCFVFLANEYINIRSERQFNQIVLDLCRGTTHRLNIVHIFDYAVVNYYDMKYDESVILAIFELLRNYS